MCLIALAWKAHPEYRLVVAANRDEFYKRPTRDAGPWPEAPDVIAGQDKEQGGTWLGITQNGRFAALTNARGAASQKNAPSRGQLVRDFLMSAESAGSFANNRLNSIGEYAGCNLLVGDHDQLFYLTNHPEPECRELGDGIHPVSNGHIDDPWPKMCKVRDGLQAALSQPQLDRDQLFDMMADRQAADSQALPNTGVGKLLEKQLSSVFIHLPVYGTRCTTVLHINSHGGGRFSERRFNKRGKTTGQTDIDLSLETP